MLAGFPGGASAKVSAADARDVSSIPGSGRPPWVSSRKGHPSLVFLPGKFHGAWRATVHGSAELDVTEHKHNVSSTSLTFS